MSEPAEREISLQHIEDYWLGSFHAMGGPCQTLVAGGERARAERACHAAAAEAWRIETTYSRFRDDNAVYRINQSDGQTVRLDAEFARLIEFADQCHRLSGGLFDISCGGLQRAWRFGERGHEAPSHERIQSLLRTTGWSRVCWRRPELTLPAGMQIDLGGIGKEYAVDRALAAAIAEAATPHVLVNFGGDLACGAGRDRARPWLVAIERPERSATGDGPRPIAVSRGALATSGNTHRFILSGKQRHGHLIDPRTGYPVPHAPLSVTAQAPSCVQAGMLSSLAMLHGRGAERFLRRQRAAHWCIR